MLRSALGVTATQASLAAKMDAVLARKVTVAQAAIAKGHVSEDEPLALLFDCDAFRGGMRTLLGSFPPHFVHTFAIKSNPTLKILKIAKECGMGFECASLGELTQALKTGIAPEKVVFDSPVKSRKELAFALERNVPLNADNFQELAHIDKLIAKRPAGSPLPKMGLRINPQVGAGSIAALSTGTATSKFGIGLADAPEEVFAAYTQRPWLNMIHVHVGSQGVPFDLAIKGIRAVVDATLEINRRVGRQQIQTIDIGGGLSVNFGSDEVKPTFADYQARLRSEVPELFDGSFVVITEFGRSLCAKAGWFLSRIEYNKVSGGRHIAAQHAGADLCVRTVYHPEQWPLRITVLDDKGTPRDGPLVEQDIAGPCCFAGDIIAHRRPLPLAQQGDYIIVHDVGGYYHSSHTKYNVRQCPAVWGYSTEGGAVSFESLQRAETVQETLDLFDRS